MPLDGGGTSLGANVGQGLNTHSEFSADFSAAIAIRDRRDSSRRSRIGENADRHLPIINSLEYKPGKLKSALHTLLRGVTPENAAKFRAHFPAIDFDGKNNHTDTADLAGPVIFVDNQGLGQDLNAAVGKYTRSNHKQAYSILGDGSRVFWFNGQGQAQEIYSPLPVEARWKMLLEDRAYKIVRYLSGGKMHEIITNPHGYAIELKPDLTPRQLRSVIRFMAKSFDTTRFRIGVAAENGRMHLVITSARISDALTAVSEHFYRSIEHPGTPNSGSNSEGGNLKSLSMRAARSVDRTPIRIVMATWVIPFLLLATVFLTIFFSMYQIADYLERAESAIRQSTEE
jgi:hypothetical protein